MQDTIKPPTREKEESQRFFYDCEFIEKPGMIELIGIGVISGQSGESYYAVSNEWKFEDAGQWVRENVLVNLPPAGELWKSKSVIAKELITFIQPNKKHKTELWGYYSAYDHVCLCWLFGRMIDLPDGMPMYTQDIKQLCDSLGNPELPPQESVKHDALHDALWNRDAWKFLMNHAAEQANAGRDVE